MERQIADFSTREESTTSLAKESKQKVRPGKWTGEGWVEGIECFHVDLLQVQAL